MSVILKDPNDNVAGLREGEDNTGSCPQEEKKLRVESMENISSSILNNNIILPPSKPLAAVEKSPMENDVVRFCLVFLTSNYF